MVNFHMEKLTVSIKDKKDKNEIIKLTVGELQSTLAQRPGAQAIKSVVQLPFHLSFPFFVFPWVGRGSEIVEGRSFSNPLLVPSFVLSREFGSQLYITNHQPN